MELLITPKFDARSKQCANTILFVVTYCTLQLLSLYAFRYEGAKLGNETCERVKHDRTIDDLKAGLLKWEDVKCSCLNCILNVLKEM